MVERMNKKNQKKIIYDSDCFESPMIEEFFGIRDQFYILRRLIITSFKTRYKRSYLGMVWSMLNPFLNMLVFVAVFSYFFKRNINHYAVYVLIGNMIFGFFRSSTAESMVQMISRGPMMRRIYLPKTTYVLASVGINLINLFLTFVPLIIVSIFDKIVMSPMMLLVFPCILLCTIFNVGASLIVSSVIPYVNDFSQVWNVLLTLWMYMTPIFYPKSIITPQYINLFRANPVTVYLTIFRDVYINGTSSSLQLWITALLFAVVTFLIGWFVFTKNSNEFAYRT